MLTYFAPIVRLGKLFTDARGCRCSGDHSLMLAAMGNLWALSGLF
jgi:hypothetical protein